LKSLIEGRKKERVNLIIRLLVENNM